MSFDPSKGQWLCEACDRRFASWEKLMQHKAYKQKYGLVHQVYCEACGQDFRDKVALERHAAQMHPHGQALHCPGCGRGPYSRVGSLMAHVEDGECGQLDSSVLDAMREEKMQFSKQLVQLTQQPVKNSFVSCMPSKISSGPLDAWKAVESVHGPGLKPPDGKSAMFILEDNALADDSSQDKPVLINDSPPNFTPLASAAGTSPKDGRAFVSLGSDDPDSPAFNVARYHSEIVGKYICPKVPCGKTFKNGGGLIGHLRSPAHGDRTFRCPYCLKTFKSLTAIASHAEDSSVNCRIRETDNYGAFMDQLTAGMVSVGPHRKDDGTPRYNTIANAHAHSVLRN